MNSRDRASQRSGSRAGAWFVMNWHPPVTPCPGSTRWPSSGGSSPWPELFVSDGERQHDFASAVAEYDRLAAAYPALGYDVILLPKVSVAERLAFILERVGTS